ncbi:L-seryl-tRNA(Sec) selenium transferase, partial [Micromonospora tulbaghiae]
MREVDPRRRVPRTDALLADPALAAAAGTLGRDRVKAAIVRAQDRARRGELNPDQVRDAALADLPGRTPRAVLNATGVVLHTNLGRAPLAPPAVDALVAAAGHTDVELDLRTGQVPADADRARAVLGPPLVVDVRDVFQLEAGT